VAHQTAVALSEPDDPEDHLTTAPGDPCDLEDRSQVRRRAGLEIGIATADCLDLIRAGRSKRGRVARDSARQTHGGDALRIDLGGHRAGWRPTCWVSRVDGCRESHRLTDAREIG
jgi:hypothetical protein